MSDWESSADVAELAIRPIIGYREWMLIGDEIVSPLARTPWHAGPMRAECLPGCRSACGLWRMASAHAGPAPDPGCVCGVYALFRPQRPWGRERSALVRGAVVLWGRIELHRLGMRAEFARIVTLALPSSHRHADGVVHVAELLDVEAVRARDLPAATLAYGQPLEPTLIPRRRRREHWCRKSRTHRPGGRSTHAAAITGPGVHVERDQAARTG